MKELRDPRPQRPFVVVRARGPAWVDARPMEQQKGWPDHAAFMDALTREGLIRLAGPLQGSREVLLVVLATDMSEIAERFAADPWTRSGLLVLKECRPWEIRLGTLP